MFGAISVLKLPIISFGSQQFIPLGSVVFANLLLLVFLYKISKVQIE